MIWLPASLLGGLFQAWRTALQQRLRSELSISAAGLVRYLYGLPFAFLFLGIWLAASGQALPALNLPFLSAATFAAVAQMAGTILLIMSFGYRGFVVGTAFSKTEAIQAAVVTALLFGDHLPPLAWVAVAIGVSGVLLLALSGKGLGAAGLWEALRQPAALCGLGAGTMFALTAVGIKFATEQISSSGVIGSALTCLTTILSIQTALHLSWMVMLDRRNLSPVWRSYRTSGQVGLLSALGSACWCIGFASAPAAIVRIIGQVEVLFTIGFARFYLRDPVKWQDVAGLSLVALGVILALVATI